MIATGGSNFRRVCEYADREPEYVHKVMELPIKRREKEMKVKQRRQVVMQSQRKAAPKLTMEQREREAAEFREMVKRELGK